MTFGQFFSNNLFTFILLFIVLALLIRLEMQRSKEKAPKISVLGLAPLLNDGAILIDLRPRDAYKKAAIAQAENYPASQFKNEYLRKFSEKNIVLYDEYGTDASKIAQQLQNDGFKNVFILDGGINAWLAENYPVVKS